MNSPQWSVPPDEWGRVPDPGSDLPGLTPQYGGWAEPPANGNPGRAFPEPAPLGVLPDAAVFGPPVPPRARAHVEVRPDSRLEQLLVLRRELIAQFEEAKAKMDAVKLAIRNEMITAAPAGTEVIDLPAGPYWPGLTVVWSRRTRFDVKRFRTDNPEVYESYRIPDPRWELRESREGGG